MQQLKTFNVTFSTLRSSQKFMADARETLNGRLPFVTISSTVELQCRSIPSCYYFGGGGGIADEDDGAPDQPASYAFSSSMAHHFFSDSLQNSSAAMWRRILCSRNTYFDAYLLMSQLTKFERASCKLQNVTCIYGHLKSKNVDNSHLKRR